VNSDSPAWGLGLATITAEGQVLDTWYPTGKLGFGTPDVEAKAGEPLPVAELFDSSVAEAGPIPGLRTAGVLTMISSLADPPKDTYDTYLRLHLLSHRMVRPHQINLDGIFGLLANVAWTSAGPCPPDQVDELRWALRARGERLAVYGIDKFPRMVDYVTPSGVRIADADRVRLGAHLASGTTVMHEGFVNFNAGTLGSSMVEGRISAGVVVGDGTDVGGGASIMGTLSGGGQEVISLGERCLIGANGGVGISLGDDCVVEAGTYITAGSKVKLPSGEVVKARDLSGQNGLLFWRNSQTGALEVRERAGRGIELNAALHAND
jgi:2,3,4,5-tetrahydropyridine-2-carboxylate N-succinyltransferase